MEQKEQKKILLVTISVGVFLVIVIGAAIMFIRNGNSLPGIIPGSSIQAGAPSVTFPGSGPSVTVTPPYEDYPAATLPSGYSGTTEAQSQEVTLPLSTDVPVQTGNTAPSIVVAESSGSTAGTATVNTTTAGTATASTTTAGTADSSATISVSRPSTAAVPNAAPSSRSSAATATTQTPPAASTPAAAPPPATASTSTASASTSSTAAATTPKTTVSTPVAARSNTNFWVQTGSFSTLARAEGVKETLYDKGITSIIENRVIDGNTFYRVRVGPYTSQNEADHWLALIQSINGFELSQVWQSQ